MTQKNVGAQMRAKKRQEGKRESDGGKEEREVDQNDELLCRALSLFLSCSFSLFSLSLSSPLPSHSLSLSHSIRL